MKQTVAALLALVLLLSTFATAVAAAPDNADVLKEYEALIKGTWEIPDADSWSAEYWSGLGSKFTFSSRKHMLFITAANEVYMAWGFDSSPKVAYAAKLAFSADGMYMILIKEDDAVVYQRK